MVEEIERLIGLLDDDSTEVAEEAKAALMSMGADVIGRWRMRCFVAAIRSAFRG